MLFTVIFFVYSLFSSTSESIEFENAPSLKPEQLRGLIEQNPSLEIVDFRSQYVRELDGYIRESVLYQENSNALQNNEDESILTVYVVDGAEMLEKAENVLKKRGRKNLRGYLEGVKKWSEVGGLVEFPRIIKFQALVESLRRSSVLLLDVRNRTELNDVGQIPNSVCVPLHEIEDGFKLTQEEFVQRYGFEKPPTDAQNVVLTCRSGRRVLVADRILKRQGYGQLRIYSGSFKDWFKHGGEVVPGLFDLDYQLL